MLSRCPFRKYVKQNWQRSPLTSDMGLFMVSVCPRSPWVSLQGLIPLPEPCGCKPIQDIPPPITGVRLLPTFHLQPWLLIFSKSGSWHNLGFPISLREGVCFPHPTPCWSTEVATSFPFADPSSGSGEEKQGKDPGPQQLEEVSVSWRAWQGTLPEDQSWALLYSLAPNSPLQEAFSSVSAPPANPTGSPGCTEMCGHCLAPLENHRPFRGTVQTFFKFVTPLPRGLHR